MPTLRALRDSGAHLLELAVSKHGGPGAVACSLALRPRRGNHVSWEAVWSAVQHVIAAAGTPRGIMPSRRAFIAAGCGDVYSALRKHGGVAAVARRAGLVYRKGPTGKRYRGPALASLADVRAEVEALAAAGICAPGTVPSCRQLYAAGKHGLYVRLCSIAGGMAPLAKLLGMQYAGRKCTRRSAITREVVLASQDALDAALRALVAELALREAPRAPPPPPPLRRGAGRPRRAVDTACALPPMLPSRRAILEAGRGELWEAIVLAGGQRAVGERLGWRITTRGRPRGGTELSAALN
jgi:hypothetical protein